MIREYIIGDFFLPDEVIKHAVENDVMRELVRCKDCKNGRLYDNNRSVACDYEELSKDPDFFCAYGERKDGETIDT